MENLNDVYIGWYETINGKEILYAALWKRKAIFLKPELRRAQEYIEKSYGKNGFVFHITSELDIKTAKDIVRHKLINLITTDSQCFIKEK